MQIINRQEQRFTLQPASRFLCIDILYGNPAATVPIDTSQYGILTDILQHKPTTVKCSHQINPRLTEGYDILYRIRYSQP